MSKPSWTSTDLAEATYAWKHGGCQWLGLWFAAHKEICGYDYGALVATVRRRAGDTTDYSQEEDSHVSRMVRRQPEEVDRAED